MSKQPEALRMADKLEEWAGIEDDPSDVQIAAELRRLHALNAELLVIAHAAMCLLGGRDRTRSEQDLIDRCVAIFSKAEEQQ